MTVKRHLRIVAVLADASDPMRIIALTNEINRRFDRAYTPTIIALDLTELVDKKHYVEITASGLLSLTYRGKSADLSLLAEKNTVQVAE